MPVMPEISGNVVDEGIGAESLIAAAAPVQMRIFDQVRRPVVSEAQMSTLWLREVVRPRMSGKVPSVSCREELKLYPTFTLNFALMV